MDVPVWERTLDAQAAAFNNVITAGAAAGQLGDEFFRPRSEGGGQLPEALAVQLPAGSLALMGVEVVR